MQKYSSLTIVDPQFFLVKAEADKAAHYKIVQFPRDHPYIAASAVVGLAVTGGVVLVPGALGIIALDGIGITAGSVAAGNTFFFLANNTGLTNL